MRLVAVGGKCGWDARGTIGSIGTTWERNVSTNKHTHKTLRFNRGATYDRQPWPGDAGGGKYFASWSPHRTGEFNVITGT